MGMLESMAHNEVRRAFDRGEITSEEYKRQSDRILGTPKRYYIHGLNDHNRLSNGPSYTDITASSFEDAATQWNEAYSAAADGTSIRIMCEGEYQDFEVNVTEEREIVKADG